MQATVPGLHAAGDVVLALSQIAAVTGQAATAIHNRRRGAGLRPTPRKGSAYQLTVASSVTLRPG